MNYVIYNESTKNVIKIVKEEPTEVQVGTLVARSDKLEVGNEFSHRIIIHTINEDGVIGGYSAFKVAPKIATLLYKNELKDIEINSLKEQLSLAQQAIDDLIFGGM